MPDCSKMIDLLPVNTAALRLLSLFCYNVLVVVIGQSKCDYDYLYAYVSISRPTEAADINFACLDSGGCTVAFSPSTCLTGCDPDCAGFIKIADSIVQGATGTHSVTNIRHGDRICSTAQVSVFASFSNGEEFPFATGSDAGTRFAHVSRRNNAENCVIVSLSSPALVTIQSEGVTVGTVDLDPYSVQTVSNVDVDDKTATFSSDDGRVLIGCFRASDNSADTVVLQPVKPVPIFGVPSQRFRGVQVDCNSLASTFDLGTSEPLCEDSDGLPRTLNEFSTSFPHIVIDGGGSFYNTPSVVCTRQDSASCLAGLGVGDGTGGESTIWWPESKFADFYVVTGTYDLPTFVSAATASCTKNGNSFVTTAGSTAVKFAQDDATPSLVSGDIIQCDQKVMLIAQMGPSRNKEFNFPGLEDESTWDAVGDSFRCPPTTPPTSSPTSTPTTPLPTSTPTTSTPTGTPITSSPSKSPTTSKPTTATPTSNPTATPTRNPTTPQPSLAPTTSKPTAAPVPTTFNPTRSPTSSPTSTPTTPLPTSTPTTSTPTGSPVTSSPSSSPTTSKPTTAAPTRTPTNSPSLSPTTPTTPLPTSSPTPDDDDFDFLLIIYSILGFLFCSAVAFGVYKKRKRDSMPSNTIEAKGFDREAYLKNSADRFASKGSTLPRSNKNKEEHDQVDPNEGINIDINVTGDATESNKPKEKGIRNTFLSFLPGKILKDASVDGLEHGVVAKKSKLPRLKKDKTLPRKTAELKESDNPRFRGNPDSVKEKRNKTKSMRIRNTLGLKNAFTTRNKDAIDLLEPVDQDIGISETNSASGVNEESFPEPRVKKISVYQFDGDEPVPPPLPGGDSSNGPKLKRLSFALPIPKLPRPSFRFSMFQPPPPPEDIEANDSAEHDGEVLPLDDENDFGVSRLVESTRREHRNSFHPDLGPPPGVEDNDLAGLDFDYSEDKHDDNNNELDELL